MYIKSNFKVQFNCCLTDQKALKKFSSIKGRTKVNGCTFLSSFSFSRIFDVINAIMMSYLPKSQFSRQKSTLEFDYFSRENWNETFLGSVQTLWLWTIRNPDEPIFNTFEISRQKCSKMRLFKYVLWLGIRMNNFVAFLSSSEYLSLTATRKMSPFHFHEFSFQV